MSAFRLVALLLVTAGGCYQEAPESTFPEPYYVSGPPGGANDPASSYQEPGEPAYETDERSPVRGAPTAPPIPSGPEADADVADGDQGDDGADAPVGEPSADPYAMADGEEVPQPGGDATARVTDAEIGATLDGYGQWVQTEDYGPVWRPDPTMVGVDFTPYETAGSWAYTDTGWAFASEYSWGWLPFHYGRWGWFHDYWAWVPGYEWSPAWVEWRHGGGVVGWRPLRPQVRDHRHSARFGRDALVRDHRRPRQHTAHWRFAAESDLGRPRIRSHLYGNLAEGLRVTSTVTAPPVRGRAIVRPGELMRNRFATGRSMPPGRHGSPQVRDHRSAPRDAYRPSIRTQPYDAPRARAYDPARTYAPPIQSGPPVRMHAPPAGTYQPPARTYAPPARTYQPPARTYAPPVGSGSVRMHAPPARTYQPPARGAPSQRYAPPVRTYTPPARTYTPSAPPARSYTPPARTYTPSAPPARSYTPPARSYTPSAPPARSYTPSAPPARSYTPPARSGNASPTSSPSPRSHGRHR